MLSVSISLVEDILWFCSTCGICITFPILGFSVYLLICFAGIETADIPETSDLGSIYDGMCNICAVLTLSTMVHTCTCTYLQMCTSHVGHN